MEKSEISGYPWHYGTTGRRKGRCFITTGCFCRAEALQGCLFSAVYINLKGKDYLNPWGQYSLLEKQELQPGCSRQFSSKRQRSGEEMRVNWHVAASGQRKSTEKEGVDADCYVDVILI